MRGVWLLLWVSGMELPQGLQTRPGGQATQPAQNRDAAVAPQTPRQALNEVLTAKDGSALERHLPEITKKKIKEMTGGKFSADGDALDMFATAKGLRQTGRS